MPKILHLLLLVATLNCQAQLLTTEQITELEQTMQKYARTYPVNWEGQYERLGNEKTAAISKHIQTRIAQSSADYPIIERIFQTLEPNFNLFERSPLANIQRVENKLEQARELYQFLIRLTQNDPSTIVVTYNSEVLLLRNRQFKFGDRSFGHAMEVARLSPTEFIRLLDLIQAQSNLEAPLSLKPSITQ